MKIKAKETSRKNEYVRTKKIWERKREGRKQGRQKGRKEKLKKRKNVVCSCVNEI